MRNAVSEHPSQRVQMVKPSPTLAVTAKAAELRAAGHDIYRSWRWRA